MIENVSGQVIGDIKIRGQLFYKDRPQGQAFYADDSKALAATAAQKVASMKLELGELEFSRIYPAPLELRIYE